MTKKTGRKKSIKNKKKTTPKKTRRSNNSISRIKNRKTKKLKTNPKTKRLFDSIIKVSRRAVDRLSEAKRKRIENQSFRAKNNYDIINFKTRKNMEDEIYRMTNNERSKIYSDLDDYQKSIEIRLKNTKDKNEKRRISNEWSNVRTMRLKLQDINSTYGNYDIKTDTYPTTNTHQLNKQTIEAIKIFQSQGNKEWGGGVNIKVPSEQFPAKLLMRQGTKTANIPEYTSDISVHTHPRRETDELKEGFHSVIPNDLLEYDNRLKKLRERVTSDNSRKKIDDLRYKLYSPYDYLPSEEDLMNLQRKFSNRQLSTIVASDQGMMVLSKKPYKSGYIEEKDIKDYHNDVIKLATIRANLTNNTRMRKGKYGLKKPDNISEAERKINDYQNKVVQYARNKYNQNDIYSDFYPSNKNTKIKVIADLDGYMAKERKKKENDFWL